MYAGLKTKLKRVVTNHELILNDQWGYDGDNRTHNFILVDINSDTIVMTVQQTTISRYIASENYDTGQITQVHTGDDHYYCVTVPYTNYKSAPTDSPDCEDLYKLCQARQEFSKSPINRQTLQYLSQRKNKQK